MTRKDLIPLLLSIFLITAIFLSAFVRYQRGLSVFSDDPADADMIFAGIYVLWIFAEMRISKKDMNTEEKQTPDFGTCQIYASAQAATILSALWFPSVWKAPNAAHIAGMGLFISGICYRLWAIHTLGQFYSHRVRKSAAHRIIDSGPYRLTRHPAYAGMIIANSGVSLYFFNWVTMCIFLLLLIPSILLRIFIEEKMLFNIGGYADFAKKRKRLCPFIW